MVDQHQPAGMAQDTEVQDLKDKVTEGAEQLRERASEMFGENYERGAEMVREYADEAAAWVKQNPLMGVAIAFGAGAVLGMLMRSRD